MNGDKPRVIIVGSDQPRVRMDNSRRGMSIRQNGKTYLAICGFLAIALLPIGLFFNPMSGHDLEPHHLVAGWIGFVTFFAGSKYIAEQGTGSDEEVTFLPTFIGITLCSLVLIVGDHGTIGLVSLAGFITIICLIIILIMTIAMALDYVWEPLVLVSLAATLLIWFAHVVSPATPEVASVLLASLSGVGIVSLFSFFLIAVQSPDID